MDEKQRQPSCTASTETFPSVELNYGQQIARGISEGDRNDLLIEIPPALLDIFERDTVLPLSRVRTNQSAAAIRITRPFLSPLAAGNSANLATTVADHRRNLSLPEPPKRAFFPPDTPPQLSRTPSSDAPSRIYQQLNNFSFASSSAPPRSTNFSDEITPIQEPEPVAASSLGQYPIGAMMHGPSEAFRRSSVHGMWEKAKAKQAKLERSKWTMIAFEYTTYAWLAMFLYFVLVGRPLWKGLTWYMWLVVSQKFALTAGVAIFVGVAVIYAFSPLLIFFEDQVDDVEKRDVSQTALIIPCYKAESIIEATLEAAKKVFPARQIFVIANGNNPTPLDNTEDICKRHGVNHIWVPVGSKIVAQFAGCYVAKSFKYVLLIDDDCALPPDFPVVTYRMTDEVKCIGYTIKSVGPNSTRGTIVQQAQDLEYKLSGIQREFAGKLGSATFPHGAISIWDREFLAEAFKYHPGFSVSEDWFLGHVARLRGSRIKMCSQVFIETETPTNIFKASGSRGGFGEMTVWKQRFHRWNFFFVSGIWYDMKYILFSWNLGWWEIGAKIFVWQEVYETILYLLTPFILPISFMVRPFFALWTFLGVVGLYAAHAAIFNAVHLRRKNEMVSWGAVLYCVPYKLILTFINVASCYWAIFKYAQYFAKPHPKVIEDEKSVEVVVRISESQIFGTYGQCMTEKGMAEREPAKI